VAWKKGFIGFEIKINVKNDALIKDAPIKNK
jgi:hypothetical protein